MLHIVCLILKIVGIILAVLLGILLLLIGILLFHPIRYKMIGECKGNIHSASAVITVWWLFHLVYAQFQWEDQKLKHTIRIAWKNIGEKESKEYEKESEKESEKKPEKESNEIQDVENTEEVEQAEKVETAEEIKPVEKHETVEKANEQETVEEASFEEIKRVSFLHNVIQKGKSWFERKKKKLQRTMKKLRARMTSLSRKKEQLQAFLQHPMHKRAYGKVKKEIMYLLNKVKPRRLAGTVEFGFDQPDITGKTLAVLGILYPWFPKKLTIEPCFDREILQGNLSFKGSIYVYHILKALCMIIISKDVRKTYQDFKKMKK